MKFRLFRLMLAVVVLPPYGNRTRYIDGEPTIDVIATRTELIYSICQRYIRINGVCNSCFRGPLPPPGGDVTGIDEDDAHAF